jgi:predicted nucleic acid-binding protein
MIMSGERLLLDTFYVQALLNSRDQYNQKARAFLPRVQAASEVWITEAILVEIGNALSTYNRIGAYNFIQSCYLTPAPNLRLVRCDSLLLLRALDLYGSRADKDWGLTDCISFVVMWANNLTDAVTGDVHFKQASFNALLA